MQFSVDAKGNTQIRSGTLNTGTTNVYIDGIGQKNYVRPSGSDGASRQPIRTQGAGANQNTVGDPGNPFPQLAIAEYKVITSNYKAEYDQVSGAAITAVTKSGTNEFEAGAFYTYTEADWRAETPAEKAAGTGKQGGDSKEYGFSLGGPIIQDRLHFFFTYEAKDFTTPNTVRAPQLLDADGNELDWVGGLTPELRENYGPVANPFDEDLFFAKLDWEFSDSDRIELSARSGSRPSRPARPACSPSPRPLPTSTTTIVTRCAGSTLGERYFNEATVTYEDTKDTPSKTSNLPGRQFVAAEHARLRLRSDPAGRRRRSARYFFTSQSGYSVQDDLTFTDFSWHGEHTIKTGIKFKDVELKFRDASIRRRSTRSTSVPIPPMPACEADPFQVTFRRAGRQRPATSPRPRRTASTASTSRTTGW